MHKEIEELVIKAKTNNEQAKVELISSFMGIIINKTNAIYIQGESRSDLIQSGAVTVLKVIHNYDSFKSSFADYTEKSIVNNYNNMIRKSSKRNYVISLEKILSSKYKKEYSLYSLENIEDKLILDELKSDLNRALDKLSFKENTLIKKYYYEKVSISKCAKELQISYSSCLNLKKHILEKLKILLKDF